MLVQSNVIIATTTRRTAQRMPSKNSIGLRYRQIWGGSTGKNPIILARNSNKHFNINMRHFSSFNNQEIKNKSEAITRANASSPAYTLFRSNVVFTLKFLSPTFKKTINQNMCIDRKGKLQIGFTPRVDGSSLINWPATNHVILGVEDIGTILYNVNNNILKTMFEFSSNDMNLNLKIITSKHDNDKNSTKYTTISLEQIDGIDVMYRDIVLNEGEFEVLKTFLVDSIPHLTAWDHFINLSIRNQYVNGSNKYGAADDPYNS